MGTLLHVPCVAVVPQPTYQHTHVWHHTRTRLAGLIPAIRPTPPLQLVQVLPWLMASTGPLLPADLTQLATSRALSCLLEMRLSTSEQGLLCNRGEPPPFSLPQVGVRILFCVWGGVEVRT